MTTIKSFQIEDFYETAVVVIEIDTAVLTLAHCAEINNFWSGNKSRLEEEAGDLVRVVARLFAAHAVRCIAEEGGEEFDEGGRSPYWTGVLLRHEGWFETPGLRLVSANVQIPEYDDLTIREGA